MTEEEFLRNRVTALETALMNLYMQVSQTLNGVNHDSVVGPIDAVHGDYIAAKIRAPFSELLQRPSTSLTITQTYVPWESLKKFVKLLTGVDYSDKDKIPLPEQPYYISMASSGHSNCNISHQGVVTHLKSDLSKVLSAYELVTVFRSLLVQQNNHMINVSSKVNYNKEMLDLISYDMYSRLSYGNQVVVLLSKAGISLDDYVGLEYQIHLPSLGSAISVEKVVTCVGEMSISGDIPYFNHATQTKLYKGKPPNFKDLGELNRFIENALTISKTMSQIVKGEKMYRFVESGYVCEEIPSDWDFETETYVALITATLNKQMWKIGVKAPIEVESEDDDD